METIAYLAGVSFWCFLAGLAIGTSNTTNSIKIALLIGAVLGALVGTIGIVVTGSWLTALCVVIAIEAGSVLAAVVPDRIKRFLRR